MSPDDVTLISIVTLVAAAVLLRPLVRALARRLEGGVVDPTQAAQLAELRDRVAELEAAGGHLAELEERVDFTERVLAQRNDQAQLPLHRTPA